MLTIKEYIEIINRAIGDVKYRQSPKNLYEPIEYTMDLGGKRIRPVLTLMSCEAIGGTWQSVLSQAMGLELFHNFTLLHDDVMDKADVRRGKATVHCKWNDNTAILSGDAMLTMATEMIVGKGVEGRLGDRLRLFNATAMEIYEGQQYDMDFESRLDVSVDEYLEMIRLKTSVLLGCACKMGALMGGGSDTQCQEFYEFGVNLGLAFQLQDDYLDIYGDEKRFGKAIGGDILNNKKTYFLATALVLARDDEREKLLYWINKEGEVDKRLKIKEVTEIYNALQIPARCNDAIDRYIKAAQHYLELIKMPVENKMCFEEFIKMLINRNR